VVNCTGISDRAFKVVATGHSIVALDGQATNFQVNLSGNSALRGSNLTAERLQAGVTGNSAMELGGEFSRVVLTAEAGSSLRAYGHAGRLDLTGSTGSSVDCSCLRAQDVDAEASTGVAMKVCAAKSLTASAKTSSRIEYSGNPKSVKATPDESSRIFL
jgi:hypothetical protein